MSRRIVVAAALTAVVVFAVLFADRPDSSSEIAALDVSAHAAELDPTRSEPSDPMPPTSATVSTTTEPPIRYTDWFVNLDPVESEDRLSVTSATAQQALDAAKPGDIVHLGPGQHGPLRIEGFPGTSAEPLLVIASGPEAQAALPQYANGATLSVLSSTHVTIEGLTVRRGTFGVIVDSSEHVVLRNLDVADVGQEGIVIGHNSSHVTVEQSKISLTGQHVEGWRFGEGIYIGTGDPAAADTTSHVTISDNVISSTSAEAIDIKHFVTDVLIDGNTIRDVDTSATGALVVGIGAASYGDPRVTIRNNIVSNVTSSRQPYLASNCIVISAPALVYNNVVFDCEHRGIWVDADVTGPAADVLIAHNTVFRGGSQGDIVVDSGNVEVSSNIGSSVAGNIASTLELFADAGANDFRLAPTALAAIDTAPGSDAVDRDVLGETRPQASGPDMGAYEFLGEPAAAGTATGDP